MGGIKTGFKSYVLLAIVFAFVSSFFFQKVQFVTADLGRFIQNGAVFFETGEVLQNNYYSYTEPNWKFSNHHWGIGVLYFMVHKISDFEGLHLFNVLLMILALFLFLRHWFARIPMAILVTALLLCMPLINWRVEVRPEFLSYFFLSIVYYNLWQFISGQISFKRLLLWCLPIMVIWVNVHIFFVVGLSLIGAFWVCSYALKSYKVFSKDLARVFIGSVLVSLINPSGVFGVLEPFMIFKEYGYMVAENQSVMFMLERDLSDAKYYVLIIVVSLLVLLSAYFFFFFKHRVFLSDAYALQAILILCFAIPAFSMIRFIPLFGLIAIPFVASNLKAVFENVIYIKQVFVLKFGFIIPILFMLISMNLPEERFYRYWNPKVFKQNSGLGLQKGINKSAEWFVNTRINGPILNNYDIGGYLIYHLFPKQKVFTDNRPEAYSIDFFKKLYYPLHESEDAWIEAEKKHQFNAIYYFRHDNTEHGQPFLIRRLQDPSWVPVFVDAWTIIMLKKNQQNADIIKKYALPPSMFSIRK